MEQTQWLRLYMNCKMCNKLFKYKFRTICEHCREAYYCSSECCFKDKISHKKNCKGLQLVDSKTLTNGPDFCKVNSRKKWIIQKVSETSKGVFLFCLHCDKKCLDNRMIFCYKCRSVFYCSQACLDIDRPNHSSTCDTYAMFLCVQDGLFHGQTYQTLKSKGLSESTETSLFLYSIHHENCSELLCLAPESLVVILQIVGPYPQSWQFAILARDTEGKTINILSR